MDVNGAALLLLFNNKKLFGAPPCRSCCPSLSPLVSYWPAAGQWNFMFYSNLASNVLVLVEVKKLLYGWFLILTFCPLIFLVLNLLLMKVVAL